MKTALIKLGIILLLIIGIIGGINTRNKLWGDKQRLSDNQATLLDTAKIRKDKTGATVKSGGIINLTKKEFKNSTNKDLVTIKNQAKLMGVKPKKIKEASLISINTDTHVKIPIIDSVTETMDTLTKLISRDSVRIAIYTNPWASAVIKINRDSIDLNILSRDTAILLIKTHKIGPWHVYNIIKKRKLGYDYSLKLTRPGADINLKEVIINN